MTDPRLFEAAARWSKLPSSWREARKSGARHYFTGVPCKHGHVAPRASHNGACTECLRIAIAKWGERNKEKKTTYSRKSMQRMRADPVRGPLRKQYMEKWRAENFDHRREYDRKRAKERPEVKRASEAKRRARKAQAGGFFTDQQILSLLDRQKCTCPNCRTSLKKGYEIDHVVPLALGGSNWISNIQLLCPLCNAQKSAKDPIKWAQEHGRLL